MQRRQALVGTAAFLGGFALIVLAGKGVNGYVPNGFRAIVPNGIFAQGIVLGALNGLLAIGLVLVYRTNRIVNFAQGVLGAFAATLASQLFGRFNWPFFPAIIVGVAVATGTSVFVEFAVIRRFAKAPRLILTVATIGVAQILGAIELAIPAALEEEDAQLRTGFSTPWSFRYEFGNVIFRGDHLLVLIVTPLVIGGLIWFLRGTGYGLAARAAAEDSDRARLLGVRVKRVSMVVWGIAGFLSALTAVLQAPVTGFQFGALGGFTLLLRALAAAVIGRMESLPITFAAAILISTAQQTLFFATGRSGPDDGLLLVIVVVALVLQRRRIGRLEGESSTWQAVEEVRPIPVELRRLPEVRWVRVGLGVGAVVFLLVLPQVITAGRVSLASAVMLYGMIGVSMVILTGWSGNVSLGQWAIVGVGALVAGKLGSQATPPDFFLCVLAGAAAGTAVAVVIGLPALRIRGLFLGVTTLAFAVASGNWIFKFALLTPDGAILRPVLFGRFDTARERSFYYVCFAGLLFALIVGRNLRNARFGRVLIGMRDNERQSQAFGVGIVRAKLSAFAVSGFIAALAGALYAFQQQSLRADRFPADVSVLIFSMVVIGGMGSLNGAILGALYIRGTQYFLPAQFQPLVTGFGVLFLLLFFPGGLGQLSYMLRDKYLRWVANRRGLLVPSLVADKRGAAEADEKLAVEAAATAHPELATVGGDL